MPTPLEKLLPWVRSQFPQVGRMRNGQDRVYLDNAAGTLMPQTVADAMAEAALFANPQPGRGWPSGPEATQAHQACRALLREFLNAGEADPVFFAESTTASLYKLREALEPTLKAGTNVVVTDCDHFSNISAWEWRAQWQVRRARMLPQDGHLDLDHLAELLDAGTRVVALTVASNGLGTLLKVEEAIRLVRERSPEAVVVLDAVHAAPHLPLDVSTLGADALAFSAYKLFGPNAGILWLRSDLMRRLSPYRVEPHTDPETLPEWGTLSNITVAGVYAALGYLLRLAERLEPSYVGKLPGYPRRRRQFKLAVHATREYEEALAGTVLRTLAKMEGVTLYGVSSPDRVSERVPTFGFTLNRVPTSELEPRFWEAGLVQLAASNHYSAAVTRGLGLAAVGRASFAHYNSEEDVAHFLRAMKSVAGG